MMAAMNEATYAVVWPQSKAGAQPGTPAPRLDTLDGATVAFLWDYVFRGDELFPVLADELRRRFPTIEIVDYDVIGNTHGHDEDEVIARLGDELHRRHVDAVVSAMGC